MRNFKIISYFSCLNRRIEVLKCHRLSKWKEKKKEDKRKSCVDKKIEIVKFYLFCVYSFSVVFNDENENESTT